MKMISEKIKIVQERMNNAALKCGRDVSGIKLMAVTKTRTADEINEAVKFADLIGENRVQEAALKKNNLILNNKKLHLIGHLQANKARKAIEIFDAIDTIDSVELAIRINRICGEFNKIMPVLIEVNTSGELNKTGIEPEKFFELLDNVLECKNLKLNGLMTVGPISDDEKIIRNSFATLRKMAEEARVKTGLELKILSMGMSGDFEYAILEGSTLIRIGSLIFGERNYNI